MKKRSGTSIFVCLNLEVKAKKLYKKLWDCKISLSSSINPVNAVDLSV